MENALAMHRDPKVADLAGNQPSTLIQRIFLISFDQRDWACMGWGQAPGRRGVIDF